MFYHLKIFLRSIRRNFTYSSINISGLAIGITASVFIFLWVYHERSFDRFHPDAERIYRITSTGKSGAKRTLECSPLPLIQGCKTDIPDIETVAIMYNIPFEAILVNNTPFYVKEDAAYVNKAWLEMFHSQIVDGSFEDYGNHPFSVALTESGAKKYFGDTTVIGQIVRINNDDFTVQAVVKDNLINSTYRYNIMATTDAVRLAQWQRQWGWFQWITFVKLHRNTDESQVAQKITDIYTKNDQDNIEASLRSLTDIHFETDIYESRFVRGDSKTVSIFGLLGILLLFTACINYINLTTARVTLRSKEVGVKKILGAKRLTLFLQFVAEAFIFSLAATMIALFLIKTFLPQYQSLVGNIALSFSSPAIWTITGIALLFTTILNGVYPALLLSSFHPVGLLKGSKIKNSNIRKALVVFQLSLSAALIISVTMIYKQTFYMQNVDLGYQKDWIVRVELPMRTLNSSGSDEGLIRLQTVKGELLSRPEIVDIAMCSERIENIRFPVRADYDWNGRAEDFNPELHRLKVDENFMRVFGLQLTEGRWFAEGAVDMQNVILNETAARELEISEPYIGQRFDMMGMKGAVIGVVKDFHFRSLHEKITPIIIYQQNSHNNMLAMKINSNKAIAEVKAIWSKFFPNDPFEYVFLDDAYYRLYQSEIGISRLILIFSMLAVVIAMLGLFGLSTFAIERRTKEIGIRKVFGASVSNIVYLLTREFLILVAVAFVIAAPVAWWAMNRWLENFAYRIDITVWIFVAGAVVTLVITLAAIAVQSVKAATENPVKALKIE